MDLKEFNRNEASFLGIILVEQCFEALNIDPEKGFSEMEDSDWGWNTWGEYQFQVDCVGDLTGYIL